MAAYGIVATRGAGLSVSEGIDDGVACRVVSWTSLSIIAEQGSCCITEKNRLRISSFVGRCWAVHVAASVPYAPTVLAHLLNALRCSDTAAMLLLPTLGAPTADLMVCMVRSMLQISSG